MLVILTMIVKHPQQLFGEIWGEKMFITHRSWKAQAHLGPPNEIVDRGTVWAWSSAFIGNEDKRFIFKVHCLWMDLKPKSGNFNHRKNKIKWPKQTVNLNQPRSLNQGGGCGWQCVR